MAVDRLEILRGPQLVDAVTEKLRTIDDRIPGGWPMGRPVPLSSGQLANLSLPDGRPLPPSLRRWLEYDASLLHIFEDLNHPVLICQKISGMMDGRLRSAFMKERGRGWGSLFSGFESLLPEDCIPLPGTSDACLFLYLGKPDRFNEYPIFRAKEEEIPLISLELPGFDIYIAQATGVFRSLTGNRTDRVEHGELKRSMLEQSELNFCNYRWVELSGDARLMDGRATIWTDDPVIDLLEID